MILTENINTQDKVLDNFITIDKTIYFNTKFKIKSEELPMRLFKKIKNTKIFTSESFGSENHQIYIQREDEKELAIYANIKYYSELNSNIDVPTIRNKDSKQSITQRALRDINPMKPIREASIPYIYIYGDIELDIELDIKNGYVSESIPVYNTGWHVKVKNNKINKKYDCLYYESASKINLKYNNLGWSFKKECFQDKFKKILLQYNLNCKEIADFICEWSALLKDNEYYTAYPLVNNELNQIVKINTSKPITQNRLWFVFEKSHKNIKEPPILSFKRDGINLLEWGGIIL